MKIHLESSPSLTVCGGRISGIKSSGRNRRCQYIAYNAQEFLNVPVNMRCVKCHAISPDYQPKNEQS